MFNSIKICVSSITPQIFIMKKEFLIVAPKFSFFMDLDKPHSGPHPLCLFGFKFPGNCSGKLIGIAVSNFR